MTTRIQQLEQAGLVERTADPTDGRATLLQVSAEGREVFSRLHLAYQQFLDELLKEWSDRQRAEVAASLSRLEQQLSGTAGPQSSKSQLSSRPAVRCR